MAPHKRLRDSFQCLDTQPTWASLHINSCTSILGISALVRPRISAPSISIPVHQLLHITTCMSALVYQLLPINSCISAPAYQFLYINSCLRTSAQQLLPVASETALMADIPTHTLTCTFYMQISQAHSCTYRHTRIHSMCCRQAIRDVPEALRFRLLDLVSARSAPHDSTVCFFHRLMCIQHHDTASCISLAPGQLLTMLADFECPILQYALGITIPPLASRKRQASPSRFYRALCLPSLDMHSAS